MLSLCICIILFYNLIGPEAHSVEACCAGVDTKPAYDVAPTLALHYFGIYCFPQCYTDMFLNVCIV